MSSIVSRWSVWRLSYSALVGMVCLLSATAASAQNGEAGVQRALQQALSQPAPDRVDAAAVETLSFERDAQVTARVQREAIEAFGRNAEQLAGLEELIGSGKMLHEFDSLLKRYGYDPSNLGDVLAAHLLISWEVANDRDSKSSPQGQRAVRRQLIGPLAAVPQVAAMSDADKQAQAERTAYLTMVHAFSYQTLKRQGNRDALRELASGTRQGLQANGIDLLQLELGDGGLVKR